MRCRAFALVIVASVVGPYPLLAQRFRLPLPIIVVDSITGLPLGDVRVENLRTRASTVTTKSGTAVLTLLDSAETLIAFRKLGYRSLTRLVAVTNRDSALSVSLVPLPQPVPEVVTAGRAGTPHRSPADTLRTLELNGFYERRRRTAAPASAFATEETLARLTTLRDLRHVTGRGLCTQNLYVD